MKKAYVYTPQGQILAQYDCNGYDDESNSVVVNGKYFYIHDRLGSVRLVIDTNSTVCNSYTYTPFGEMFATECNETVYNPFKFTGQWYDSEIGQYYLRARQYDPVLMRFTAIDPVRGKYNKPLTLHPYLYCLNSPINHSDPSGRYLDTVFSIGWGLEMWASEAAVGGLAIGYTYAMLQSTAYHNLMLAFSTASSEAIQNIGHAMAKVGSRLIEQSEKWANKSAQGELWFPPGGGGDWKNKAKRIGCGILALLGQVGAALSGYEELQNDIDEDWEELYKDRDFQQYWDTLPESEPPPSYPPYP